MLQYKRPKIKPGCYIHQRYKAKSVPRCSCDKCWMYWAIKELVNTFGDKALANTRFLNWRYG